MPHYSVNLLLADTFVKCLKMSFVKALSFLVQNELTRLANVQYSLLAPFVYGFPCFVRSVFISVLLSTETLAKKLWTFIATDWMIIFTKKLQLQEVDRLLYQ